MQASDKYAKSENAFTFVRAYSRCLMTSGFKNYEISSAQWNFPLISFMMCSVKNGTPEFPIEMGRRCLYKTTCRKSHLSLFVHSIWIEEGGKGLRITVMDNDLCATYFCTARRTQYKGCTCTEGWAVGKHCCATFSLRARQSKRSVGRISTVSCWRYGLFYSHTYVFEVQLSSLQVRLSRFPCANTLTSLSIPDGDRIFIRGGRLLSQAICRLHNKTEELKLGRLKRSKSSYY